MPSTLRTAKRGKGKRAISLFRNLPSVAIGYAWKPHRGQLCRRRCLGSISRLYFFNLGGALHPACCLSLRWYWHCWSVGHTLPGTGLKYGAVSFSRQVRVCHKQNSLPSYRSPILIALSNLNFSSSGFNVALIFQRGFIMMHTHHCGWGPLITQLKF